MEPTKEKRDSIRERIAMDINHGLDNLAILQDLQDLQDLMLHDINVSRPTLIAIIRDLMMDPP